MSRRSTIALLLLAYAYVLTMTWQVWIGYTNVYSANPEQAALVHQAILENRTPPGVTWDELGANGTNIRRLPVVAAETVHRAAGLPLKWTYFALDTVFIYAMLVLLAVYLRRWLSPTGVALGLLYFGAVGSMTYLFHYFHPWDRISQLTWLTALYFLRDGRFWPLLATLAVGMTVKYDLLPLPALYAAATWRKRPLPRWLGETLALGVVSVGVLYALQQAYPGGFSATAHQSLSDRTLFLVESNLAEIRARFFAYPPALMFGLPLVLAFAGWRRLDRFHRWAVLFGCSLFVPFSLASNLREVRAHVPILFLVLPPALLTLQRVLGAADRAADGGGTAASETAPDLQALQAADPERASA